ncbi:hypothetical protein CRV02_08890 [Arcobacter sp. CECT 8989]|uniref:tetratricopeptide repeat protein n=1 Tax=Arcobacter sp. CECT 8989 TaxID=2044509 RepID=UPI00100B129F|nr:tetratricopeptide repeat protein [Arcobacter sp. CECT 8989]RXK00774.1 hypothetical protein CRV02_08890 [Arcobacter sp. CECT 8989]
MKKIYSLLFIILILPLVSFSNEGKIDSQPEILFKYDKLKENQEKLRLQVEFNKAILLLEKEEYKKAIETFKITSELLKVPSFLNIGIAYYKLGQIDNALLYLNNIYDYKEAIYSDTYSYISASYYLYLIKKERKYLETIVNITKKFKTLTEHSKRLVVDTFILLKDYELALKILETMEFPMNMKKALLHLKLKDYIKAERYLQRAKEESFNQSRTNLILWLMVYRDLKANDIQKLLDRLKELEKVKDTFKVNQKYPLKIFFNKAKYTPKEYLKFVTKFDKNRKIDFLFYFAPFVFSDKQEILYDISKGFIFNSEQNVESLEQMVKYNAKFIEIIQEDPIIRVNKMQSFLKEDSNSYIYYNLALCYAQISDFHNAYKYFSKAYKLNPGNKLYSVMTLISAEKINRDIKDKEYIVQNIKSKDGMYKYFGQTVYREYVEPKFKVIFDPLAYNQTIFYKALDYLDKLAVNRVTLEHPLFIEHYKDPLVYLMKSTIRREGENDYNYFARLQDKTPLNINNNFLEGPLVITKYYIDLLKAIGLFHKADLTLSGKESPSYLRTKALRELHNSKPKESLKILYTLQKEYKLEDKYTMYLIVASQLEDDKYNEALLQISLIKAILKDPGADFLTGVQLVQDLKLNSASQYFIEPYKDSLIDFKLLNFDSLLESM